MSNALATLTFGEMEKLAEAIARSGLFGMKTPEAALALMAISAAEGVHPALAARDYHIISGKPTLKSDAMLSRFQAAGGKMTMQEYTDTRVVAEFSHPQGGKVTIDWDIARAKLAGLGKKDTWLQYPRQMLRARVISEGVRTVFPGATAGMMAPEEAIDAPDLTERDVTPDKPLTGVAALQARVAKITEAEPAAVLDTATGEIADATPAMSYAEVSDAIGKAVAAKDSDALLVAVDLMRSVADEQHRAELDVQARAAWKTIKKAA